MITTILSYHDSKFLYCQSIRTRVFIQEQNVPEARERDDYDLEARHYLFELDGRPVGTARSRLDSKGGVKMVKIERFALLPEARGAGRGQQAFQSILEDCRTAYPLLPIVIGAQLYLQPFYERLGFKAEGDIYRDAGIDHITMRYLNHLT